MGRNKKKPLWQKAFLFIGETLVAGVKAVLNVPGRIKRYVLSSLMFLLALISFLSFFDLAGKGGKVVSSNLFSFFGQGTYLSPLIFLIYGVVFLWVPKKQVWIALLGGFILLSAVAGLLTVLRMPSLSGGSFGAWEGEKLVALFGELVSFFTFLTLVFLSSAALWHIIENALLEEEEKKELKEKVSGLFSPSNFKVLEVEPQKQKVRERKEKKEEEEEPEKPVLGSGVKTGLPPLDLLDEVEKKKTRQDTGKHAEIIKGTFDNFEIDVKMTGANTGPTVTQYTLRPPKGVKLSKITGLSNNLALALAAHPVRIEAPIPGKSLVGIEVPNERRSTVGLKELLSTSDFKKEDLSLPFALGKDVAGEVVIKDIARMPHLLVAGATGTGKTVFLNSLILSLLYRNEPSDLRLILIDPKRVEFSTYKELPHLLCPIISDSDKTINVLTWLVEEMERRFKILSGENSRNIYSYNKKVAKKKEKDKMPSIVLIIDELADLMVARGKELESKIVRIAQMARAVGIHLVVATQRPSVEVITGLIKANITSRISFQLPTQTDSRTVLDMSGAEKLLGAGDLLFLSPKRMKPLRVQGPYVSEEEVKSVMDWVEVKMAETLPPEDEASLRLKDFIKDREAGSEMIDGMEKDPLLDEAREIVVRSQKGSASLLQRRLQIGYVRAARILDMLEAEGVVGSARSGKARKVLISKQNQEDDFGEDFFDEEDMV